MSGVKSIFGISDSGADTRTVLKRATKMTQSVKTQPVNFASLALEKSTAHEKMILIAHFISRVVTASRTCSTFLRFLKRPTRLITADVSSIRCSRTQPIANILNRAASLQSRQASQTRGVSWAKYLLAHRRAECRPQRCGE